MRCRTGLKSAVLGLLGAVRACDHTVRAGRGRGQGTVARRRHAALLRARRRRQQMSAGAAGRGGPRRPIVRQQDRPDADEAGGAAAGRAHHRCRAGSAAQDSRRRQGDRSQPGDGAARHDRCAHAHVQPAAAGHVAGDLDAHRRPESAGRPAGGLHDGARHELPRQRLWRRRYAQRHQRGPHRRSAVSGVRPRHRVGRDAGHRAGESADEHRGALGRGSARGGARAHRARRRLDQAVPDRRLFLQPDRRGPIRADLSDAGAAGADRRDPSPRPQDRLSRLWRRRPEERHHRRLRHHRARLRPRSGAGQHDGREGARLRSDARSATPSPTWTTTTTRTPAASTG